MEVPFEILSLFVFAMLGLAILSAWKKIPFGMTIAGAFITFLFILTDSVTALGDSQTCTTAIASTTCEFEPYVLDMWIKIIFMLLGCVLMIGGALIWKATENE